MNWQIWAALLPALAAVVGVWVNLNSVLANALYKAHEYGRADIADIIIFIAAIALLSQ